MAATSAFLAQSGVAKADGEESLRRRRVPKKNRRVALLVKVVSKGGKRR